MRIIRRTLASAIPFIVIACTRIPANHVASVGYQAAAFEPSIRLPFDYKSALIGSLALSSDGKKVLITTSRGEIKIWDAENHFEERSFDVAKAALNGSAWSSDGRMVALCGSRVRGVQWGENTLLIVDAITGQQVQKMTLAEGMYPGSVCFSNDDSLLAWSEIPEEIGGTQVVVMSRKTGERAIAQGPFPITFHDNPVFISPDQRHLYWRNCSWDIQTEPNLALVNRHDYKLEIYAYSRDGKWGYRVAPLYLHDLNSRVPENVNYSVALYQIDLRTGQIEVRREFKIDAKAMEDLSTAVSPDGRQVAIASVISDIHIIDLSVNVDLGRLIDSATPSNDFRSITFFADGQHLAGIKSMGAFVWKVPASHPPSPAPIP